MFYHFDYQPHSPMPLRYDATSGLAGNEEHYKMENERLRQQLAAANSKIREFAGSQPVSIPFIHFID